MIRKIPTVSVGVVLIATVTLAVCSSRGSDERLMAAVSAGDTGEAQRILDLGVDPDCSVVRRGDPTSVLLGGRASWRVTPLMLAVQRDDEDMVRLLLDAGADPAMLPEGETEPALVYAIRPAWGYNEPIALLLAEHGADPFQPIYSGGPLLAWTISPYSFRVFRALVVTSVQRDRSDEIFEAIPGILPTAGKMPTRYWSAYLDEVSRLIELRAAGGEAAPADALMLAILVADEDAVVRSTAGVAVRSSEFTRAGWSPLAWGLASGNTAISQQLLAVSGPTAGQAMCDWGGTALHCAVQGGDAASVRAVLDLNPEALDALDDDRCSALALAIYRQYDDVVELLLSAGADAGIGWLRGMSTQEHLDRWKKRTTAGE